MLKSKSIFTCILALFFYSLSYSSPRSSDSTHNPETRGAVNIFLDCERCDADYVRSEITFVNHVRDQAQADVHILVTTQQTGGGGKEYTLAFIGKKASDGINDTLIVQLKKSDTDEIIRKELVRNLKLGLIRYVAKTSLANQISISYTAASQSPAVVNKWDYWVFSTNLNSYFNGEQSRGFINVYGSISANRITADVKVALSANGSYNGSSFDTDGGTFSSFSRSKGFFSSVVFGIDDHWSAGFESRVRSATYDNTQLAFGLFPAIEYNLFPYSQSTRRQLRFNYNAGPRYADYEEETIYDKTSELLFSEQLSISWEQKETWGSVSATLEGSNYFHDFRKNRFQLFTNLSIRLFEGLSLRLDGNFSAIHDQLGLRKGRVSTEAILLQRTQLETQYEYWGSFGFSYSFGSIFNNVVNARFGN